MDEFRFEQIWKDRTGSHTYNLQKPELFWNKYVSSARFINTHEMQLIWE